MIGFSIYLQFSVQIYLQRKTMQTIVYIHFSLILGKASWNQFLVVKEDILLMKQVLKDAQQS